MQRIERLQVTNHERWGKLVKTWATGTNYLDDDNAYLAQLSDGLGEHGFGVVTFNSGPALLDYFDEGGKAAA